VAALGIALLVGFSPAPTPVSAGAATTSLSPTTAGLTSGTADFPVVFNETGLPTGTSWTVTLNGTLESSTTATITFEEPNGSYLFTVQPVSGYSTILEGNITVNGAPFYFTVEFTSNAPPPPQSCPGFLWAGANNTLYGDCTGGFNAEYRSYNASTGWTFDNDSFRIGPVAEVTPSGTIDALAVPGWSGHGSVAVAYSPHEVNLTDTIVGFATNAVGVNSTDGQPDGVTPQWIPEQLPGAGGSTIWSLGGVTFGNVTLVIVFHFANGTGTSRVKFDVKVLDWPWVSSGDSLGLAVEQEAYALPGGSHFVYTVATDTISQLWNSNDTPIASLAFGPTANTTGASPTELRVSDQVELFANASVPTVAVALLSFSGPGGYRNMTYDPWVEFGTTGAVPVSLTPGGASGAFPPLALVVGVFGALVAGLLLAVYAQRARRRPIEDGLRSAS
jgi:hypothetical protein